MLPGPLELRPGGRVSGPRGEGGHAARTPSPSPSSRRPVPVLTRRAATAEGKPCTISTISLEKRTPGVVCDAPPRVNPNPLLTVRLQSCPSVEPPQPASNLAHEALPASWRSVPSHLPTSGTASSHSGLMALLTSSPVQAFHFPSLPRSPTHCWRTKPKPAGPFLPSPMTESRSCLSQGSTSLSGSSPDGPAPPIVTGHAHAGPRLLRTLTRPLLPGPSPAGPPSPALFAAPVVLQDPTGRVDSEPHVDAALVPRVQAIQQVHAEEAPEPRRVPRGAHRNWRVDCCGL